MIEPTDNLGLIALAGLPGTGKTTIARALSRALGAVHLRIDSIEQALRESTRRVVDVGDAGYVAAYRVAEDNLRLGHIVVADSVNPLRITRDAWRATAERAGVRITDVEIVCSSPAEHRRRIETRSPDIEGHALPTWADVVGRRYEPWDGPRLVIDTATATVDDAVEMIIEGLRP